jgi:hypothetical protein
MLKDYPLYDDLVEKITLRENPNIDIKLLCNNINNISNNLQSNDYLEHYNEICALIIHHHFKLNFKSNMNILPFNSKIMFGGKGILFNISKFDPLLQQIIAQYINEN